jgi:hypothetical protein
MLIICTANGWTGISIMSLLAMCNELPHFPS